MALIKCSECGCDVSDKAEKCPNCGCPIEEILKMTKDDKKQKARYSIQIGKKGQALIVFIVILSICLLTLKKENVFKEYTDYIGQSYEKLPSDYDTQEILNGLWQAERVLKAEDEKFAFVDGTIRYSYFDKGIDVYDTEANEIHDMVWAPEYEDITDNDIENTKKLLEEAYGKFDERIELDNTSEVFAYQDEDFLCERYLWNNKNGIDVFMDVRSENMEYISIQVTWRKCTI